MTKYEIYTEAKKDRERAEYWNELPNGEKYQTDKFDISVAHCTLILKRMGQQRQGGQSYWETSKIFGEAIMEVIKENPDIIESAIKKLKQREIVALNECQEYAENILALIKDAVDLKTETTWRMIPEEGEE